MKHEHEITDPPWWIDVVATIIGLLLLLGYFRIVVGPAQGAMAP